MSAPAATGVICPLCGWTGPEFLPQGRNARANALCGQCSSLERHRALYLYLRDKTQLLAGETRLLHFAPERALREVFSSDPAIEYVTTDLEMSDVSVRMDISEMIFKDGTFDCVICSHVLEHVPDDRRAMREIFRVLKPQGLALIMVPINRASDVRGPIRGDARRTRAGLRPARPRSHLRRRLPRSSPRRGLRRRGGGARP